MDTSPFVILSLCFSFLMLVVGLALGKNKPLAFETFVRLCHDPAFPAKLRRLIEGKPPLDSPKSSKTAKTSKSETPAAIPALAPVVVAPPPPVAPAAPPPAPRHDALSLLAVLQREARLIDFLKEPVDSYTDAQIGAAVRSVHKDSGAVIERMFGVEPLAAGTEGAPYEVPAGYDPAKFRLVGKVPAKPPLRGTLAHAGWKATRCEVPDWTGKAETAQVLAPAEVEF